MRGEAILSTDHGCCSAGDVFLDGELDGLRKGDHVFVRLILGGNGNPTVTQTQLVLFDRFDEDTNKFMYLRTLNGKMANVFYRDGGEFATLDLNPQGQMWLHRCVRHPHGIK